MIGIEPRAGGALPAIKAVKLGGAAQKSPAEAYRNPASDPVSAQFPGNNIIINPQAKALCHIAGGQANAPDDIAA